MVKITFFSFLLIGLLQNLTAQKLIDRAGYVKFFSEAPLENIEAINQKVLAALDTENGKLAISITIKEFQFKKSLMQEHFNENYMESDQFPKAIFVGSLIDFNKDKLLSGDSFTWTAEGTLTIHGVARTYTCPVAFETSKAKLNAQTTFTISVADHDVKIPSMLIQNIAEKVEVTAIFNFDISNK